MLPSPTARRQAMAYIVVTKDRPPGRAQLIERVGSSDFEGDQFRANLSERLAWAVEDAERELPDDLPAQEPAAAPADVADDPVLVPF
jgi:hypothetical protein